MPPGCAVAPYLPSSYRVSQLAGDVTIERSLFGLHLYDIPLYSDGVVPVPSAHRYGQSAAGEPDYPGFVESDEVECRVGFDGVFSAAAAGLVAAGGAYSRRAELAVLATRSAVSLVNDFETFDALQAEGLSVGLVAFLGYATKMSSCGHVNLTRDAASLSTMVRYVAGAADALGDPCRTDPLAPRVREAVAGLPPYDYGGGDDEGWGWDAEYVDGNYSPCATLSGVSVGIQGATGGSPMHVLLFHRGELLGTGTEDAYRSTYVDADRSTDDTVVVHYVYSRPWDGSTAGASGRATVRYHWDGDSVEMLDELPADMVDPPESAVISLDGYGPFRWGDSEDAAEQALGHDFEKQDLGLGCSQATLGEGFAPTFAIQDGILAAGAVVDEFTVTDTGIALGDPVPELLRAYPGIRSAPDPSDAFSTRYTFTAGNRVASFVSFDGATVDYIQFGLAGSIGEAPCV
jgi:hypothetical protein